MLKTSIAVAAPTGIVVAGWEFNPLTFSRESSGIRALGSSILAMTCISSPIPIVSATISVAATVVSSATISTVPFPAVFGVLTIVVSSTVAGRILIAITMAVVSSATT